MKIKKLIPAINICYVCSNKLIKTSRVAIINENIIVHAHPCAMSYIINPEQKIDPNTKKRLPQITKQEPKNRISPWDDELYFTSEYNQSSKSISEETFKLHQNKYTTVYLPRDPIKVKKIIRDRIWKAVGRKYLQQLQFIHALNRIWEKQQNTLKSNFHKTFIPSVLDQFRSKGYLSKKQWELVEALVHQKLDSSDREYFSNALYKAHDMETMELPDRLRYMQRKNSFIKWYNQQEGINEESE